MTGVVMVVAAALFESDRWTWPNAQAWGSIWYNAIGVFVFAHATWFYLARAMPPVASTLSR